jgi:hypothetical protein
MKTALMLFYKLTIVFFNKILADELRHQKSYTYAIHIQEWIMLLVERGKMEKLLDQVFKKILVFLKFSCLFKKNVF